MKTCLANQKLIEIILNLEAYHGARCASDIKIQRLSMLRKVWQYKKLKDLKAHQVQHHPSLAQLESTEKSTRANKKKNCEYYKNKLLFDILYHPESDLLYIVFRLKEREILKKQTRIKMETLKR